MYARQPLVLTDEMMQRDILQPFTLTIEPVWHTIRELRAQLATLLAYEDSELSSTAIMTASELVENAIKYGERVSAAPTILFSLWQANGQLHIETVNGCTDQVGIQTLLRRVDEIAAAPQSVALYLERLQVLSEKPGEPGKLGLYRVAFEGQFRLTCGYRNQVVTMRATRKIP